MYSLIRWAFGSLQLSSFLRLRSRLSTYISGTVQWLLGNREWKAHIGWDIESSREDSLGEGDTAAGLQTTTPVGNIEYGNIESKGETISGGATGLVERLPSGNIVKSPWSGFRAAECRRDMTTEFQIYERLGPHPRLVKIISWDPENCVLIMEYMPNGSLKDYLCEHNDKVSKSQRLQWAREAAEGLQRLHSANVIHCDVEPKNFLLDSDLGLKIADFSGSSLDGSRPSACAGVRFSEPNFNWRSPPTVRQDLYSLGSTIYNIMTGRPPFQELPSNEVEELYKANTFPELKDILCGGIIQQCWYNKVASAQEVYNAIQIIEMDLTCEIIIIASD